MRYVGVQTFGGGMDLGLVQAGWELVHRAEQKGGFGLAECDANRHLLGQNWTMEDGEPSTWQPFDDIQAVFSLPPCSGFSLMSIRAGNAGSDGGVRDYRGIHAPVNSCMWATVEYAARVNDGDGPLVLAFESVQGAGRPTEKGGLPLMRQLRAHLEQLTGHQYTLTHLFHNAAGLGGASIRPRYFFVASRVPFGINSPKVTRVPTMRESIGDLDLDITKWDPQPYAAKPNFWTADKRNPDGRVDGNMTREIGGALRDELTGAYAVGWLPGEQLIDVAKRHYETTGAFPDGWSERAIERSLRTNFQGGVYQPGRWREERAARVLAGGALYGYVHPWRDRTFTYREVARLMGFPDAWKLDTYTETGHHTVFGKAVTVQCGKALGGWVMDAINGNPGGWAGDPMPDGDREFVINITHDHKAIYNERTGAHEDSRSDTLKKAMAKRPA